MQSFEWNKLLLWYEANGRHSLPWRDYTLVDRTRVYRVWLSEILLQQTQASRVVGFFDRMIERFPTIESLAGTEYDTFFPYYQGLGYYSRAHNILKTAQIVVSEYGGIFPREKVKLQKLHGVGGYTSSAILAFGYGDPYLAWDTNLEKVFSRYYKGTKDIKLTDEEKEIIESDFRSFVSNGREDGNGGSGAKTVGAKMREEGGGAKLGEASTPLRSIGNTLGVFLTPETFDTFGHESMKNIVRAINNALMDFASLVDLKEKSRIDWENYILKNSLFYIERGENEEEKIRVSRSFPTPDATIIVTLHRDHKMYFSLNGASYTPFILPPSLTRDTRKYVQDYFRETYGLELSVRPPHNKWIEDGKPFIAVNAQVQTGKHTFSEWGKNTIKK